MARAGHVTIQRSPSRNSSSSVMSGRVRRLASPEGRLHILWVRGGTLETMRRIRLIRDLYGLRGCLCRIHPSFIATELLEEPSLAGVYLLLSSWARQHLLSFVWRLATLYQPSCIIFVGQKLAYIWFTGTYCKLLPTVASFSRSGTSSTFSNA